MPCRDRAGVDETARCGRPRRVQLPVPAFSYSCAVGPASAPRQAGVPNNCSEPFSSGRRVRVRPTDADARPAFITSARWPAYRAETPTGPAILAGSRAVGTSREPLSRRRGRPSEPRQAPQNNCSEPLLAGLSRLNSEQLFGSLFSSGRRARQDRCRVADARQRPAYRCRREAGLSPNAPLSASRPRRPMPRLGRPSQPSEDVGGRSAQNCGSWFREPYSHNDSSAVNNEY